jgi:hypothetical protein
MSTIYFIRKGTASFGIYDISHTIGLYFIMFISVLVIPLTYCLYRAYITHDPRGGNRQGHTKLWQHSFTTWHETLSLTIAA